MITISHPALHPHISTPFHICHTYSPVLHTCSPHSTPVLTWRRKRKVRAAVKSEIDWWFAPQPSRRCRTSHSLSLSLFLSLSLSLVIYDFLCYYHIFLSIFISFQWVCDNVILRLGKYCYFMNFVLMFGNLNSWCFLSLSLSLSLIGNLY